MIKKRKLNLREKVLLCFALLVVSGAGYFVVRYKPALLSLQQLEAETQQLASTLQTQRMPRPLRRDSAFIEQDLKDLETQLSERLKQLKALESRYVDANSTKSLQGLIVEISVIANASGVMIRETLPYTGASEIKSGRYAVSRNLLAFFNEKGAYPRPLKTLRLEGTYQNLRRLIEGMMRLNHQVVVLQFGFRTISGHTLNKTRSLLSAEIVVAL